MTIAEAIEMADTVHPNALPAGIKVRWLQALEGRVVLEVLLLSPAEYSLFDLSEDDMDRKLLVDPPYDDIYPLWLGARIDEAHGEYDKYHNAAAVYNARWNGFVNWFLSRYDPVQGYRSEEDLYGKI